MQLTELIIRAHVHAHAAELAIKTNSPMDAWSELYKLYLLLKNETPAAKRAIQKTAEPE